MDALAEPKLTEGQAEAAAEPISQDGVQAIRGRNGRFLPGNTAALVVGAESKAFWEAQAGKRREIEAASRDRLGCGLR
jgi:hypothetical protein